MDDFLHWVAIYDGGPSAKAIHQKSFFNKDLPEEDRPCYEDLDRTRLRQFQMRTPDGRIIFSVPFKEGQGGRLIWRRRIRKAPGGGEERFYVVGKKGAFVAFVLPDLSIMVDDNFSEDNVLLGSVELVSGEERSGR